MGNLFSNFFAMSIAGSVVVVLMLLLRPITTKFFSAKWQYGVGKMAVAFFLIPVFFFIRKLPLVQPIMESYPAETSTTQNALPSHAFVDAMGTLMERHFMFEVTEAILFIWLVGAMVFAGWHFYCYCRFSKQLREDSFPVLESTPTVLLSSCKEALGIHDDLKLMKNSKITSPMLVGLRRPIIVLPTSSLSEVDLKLILNHELIHLKQKDLWVKMFALLAGTLHWFNPLAHVLRKDISIWGELSCDEAIASEMSHEERKLYGEAILSTLDNHSGMNTAFCSSLCNSKKHIERRLIKMLNIKKPKKYIAVFAVAAILAVGGTGLALSSSAGDDINNIINVAVEKQESKPIIGPTEIKQSINVDVNSLDIGEFLAVGGPYILEEGDIILYDITADGNGNLNADFRKSSNPTDDKGYLGETGLSSNFMKNSSPFIVPGPLTGTYYLWIGNFDGKILGKNYNNGVLHNVKGTVLIAVDNVSKNGYFSAIANEKQLEVLNELYDTDISFGELTEAVYPEALTHIPEQSLQYLYESMVAWPDEGTLSQTKTITH
ncbi:MAG: M56 family metallopeptidase [Dethiobacteria bacterium]|jgi:bla regulator protein BlaR1